MTQNDKTSSINILSTPLADVYRQFHTATTDSLPFSLFFYMAFYFLSSCQPASHLLSVYMESALSSLALGFRVGELFKSCAGIILREMLLPTRNPKDMGLWQWVCNYACVCVCAATVRRQCKNECIYGTLYGHCSTVTARTIHIHWLCHISTLGPPTPPSASSFFPPFFPSLYAYHFITLSTASAVAGTQGETLPLFSHAISLTSALMCAMPYSSREKPRGDSFGDRLITAFHQSSLRSTPFAIGSWQEPTFSIFTFPQFFRSF